MNRIITILVIAIAGLILNPDAHCQKRKPTAKPAAKCAWISFENSSDILQIASDSKNVYVALAWTKYLVIIDKNTGSATKLPANNDVHAVVTSGDKCYYFVATKGVFSYDPATGQTDGPLFGIKASEDTFSVSKMAVSPDERYLLCSDNVVDLTTGEKKASDMSSTVALNNLGGAYLGRPEACYCPAGGESFTISNRVVVEDIFADPVSKNAYFCCEQGVGFTPEVPKEDAGLTRVKSLGEERVYCINRDDAGDFIFGIDGGIAIGGKNLEDPLTVFKPLNTGIKEGFVDLNVGSSSARMITPDKSGNILIGCPYSGTLVIFNPNGLKGYTALRGKCSRL